MAKKDQWKKCEDSEDPYEYQQEEHLRYCDKPNHAARSAAHQPNHLKKRKGAKIQPQPESFRMLNRMPPPQEE